MSRTWTPRRFVARRRSRVIIAATIVVMMFVAAFLIGGRRTVSIEVNGESREVSTYAMSVDRLLESQGITVKSHDMVDSTSGAWLADHAVVTVRSAYQVELTIDGARVPYWTVAQSVDQLLSFFNQANDQANAITVNISDVYNQLTGGLVINKQGPVKVIADGKESIAPNGKVTAASILDSKGITLGKDDRVNVEEGGDMPTLRVQRVTRGQEQRDVSIAFVTVTVVNDSLKPGESRVASEGKEGVKQQTYDVTYVDGKADTETLVSEVITKQPENRVIEVGPAKTETKSDSTTDTKKDTNKADGNKTDSNKADTTTDSKADTKKDDTANTTPKADTSTPSTDNGGNQSNQPNQSNQSNQSNNNGDGNAGRTNAGNTDNNANSGNQSTDNNQSNGNTGTGNSGTGNTGNSNSGNTGTDTSTPTGSWHLNPTQAKALARGMMRDYYGWGDDQYNCLVPLWEHESNWLWYAENPSSGAYGIPQALPPDKMGEGWHDDVAVQISWGLGYIKDNFRYGTPCITWEWWQANKWY